MSVNPESIYIFVKGNKGKWAYIITDHQFNQIHSDIRINIKDEKGKELWQIHTDSQAILAALEFVCNPESKKIPLNPIVHVCTSYEPIYHVATEMKNANKLKEFKREFDEYSKKLKAKYTSKLDRLKIQWIPGDFDSQMKNVVKLLQDALENTKHHSPKP